MKDRARVALLHHPMLMLMTKYKKEMGIDLEVMERQCRNAS
jgi:hypothetical protein